MKLLVVEDCSDILSLLKERLTDQGHEVVTSTNGKEALELLRQIHPNIQVILSDYEMPFVNGLDLFERVMELPSPHPHFILISGKAGQIEDVIDKGIYALLAKPISFEILDSYLGRIEAQITGA